MVFVDPLTGKIFAKGIVKNTGTCTIASVTTYADEFDNANHFINRTQPAPNTMPLKPGDSFNYTIDLGGYFTGKFDNHECSYIPTCCQKCSSCSTININISCSTISHCCHRKIGQKIYFLVHDNNYFSYPRIYLIKTFGKDFL
jgi:hypothetical protein